MVMPLDPAGGGSWTGVNDAGMVIAILNRADRRPPFGMQSRGLVVTRLLGAGGLPDLLTDAIALDLRAYRSFELIAVRQHHGVTIRNLEGRRSVGHFEVSRPRLFTSSSVAVRRTVAARRQLFRDLLLHADPADWHAAQRRFHARVAIARADARTVSRTTIDVNPTNITLSYEPSDARAGAVCCDVRF